MQKNFVVRKVAEYRGIPILVLQVGNIFLYVTVIRQKFYSSHIVSAVPFLQMFSGYTEKQLLDTTNLVLTMARTTIDTILDTK